MPYAVWISKVATEATKYELEGMPGLPANVAVPITKEQLLTAKFMHDVVVFDKVLGRDEIIPEEKEVEFEGKKYRIRDGMFDPPIEEGAYKRMQEKGLI